MMLDMVVIQSLCEPGSYSVSFASWQLKMSLQLSFHETPDS